MEIKSNQLTNELTFPSIKTQKHISKQKDIRSQSRCLTSL